MHSGNYVDEYDYLTEILEYVAPTVQRILGQFYTLHSPLDIKIVYETEDITVV